MSSTNSDAAVGTFAAHNLSMSKRTRDFTGRPGHPTTFTAVAGAEPDDVVGQTMVAEAWSFGADVRPDSLSAGATGQTFNAINLDDVNSHIHSPGGDNGKAEVKQVTAHRRDSRYRIQLADGGRVSLDIRSSGISNKQPFYSSDDGQLLISRQGNDVTVRFAGKPENYSNVARNLDEAERIALEVLIREQVTTLTPGADVEFAGDEPWTRISGVYTSRETVSVQNTSSLSSSSTDDLMNSLENQWGYHDVRNGLIEDTVNGFLIERKEVRPAKKVCSTGGNHSWTQYPAPAGPYCGRCGINKTTFSER
jgi:hypothetical protein